MWLITSKRPAKFSVSQLSELMDLVEAYPMHEEEGAKIWLSEHPEVNEFFPTFAEK